MLNNQTLDQLAVLASQLDQTQAQLDTARHLATTTGTMTFEFETALAQRQDRIDQTRKTIRRLKAVAQYV